MKDRETKTYASDECLKFMDECKERGLLVGKGGLMGNVVRVAPPLNITREDVTFILETMDQVFHSLTPVSESGMTR